MRKKRLIILGVLIGLLIVAVQVKLDIELIQHLRETENICRLEQLDKKEGLKSWESPHPLLPSTLYYGIKSMKREFLKGGSITWVSQGTVDWVDGPKIRIKKGDKANIVTLIPQDLLIATYTAKLPGGKIVPIKLQDIKPGDLLTLTAVNDIITGEPISVSLEVDRSKP